MDDYIFASINQVGGLGKHHPVTGHYGELVIRGLATREEADEYQRALFRCAHHLNRHGIAPVSMSAKVERNAETWQVRFKAIDKTLARQHVLERYGPDRSKWPYDPRQRVARES